MLSKAHIPPMLRIAALMALGGLLAACATAVEALSVPSALAGPLSCVYRVIFLASLPAETLLRPFVGAYAVRRPLGTFAVYTAAPLLWYAAWLILLRTLGTMRNLRGLNARPVSPAERRAFLAATIAAVAGGGSLGAYATCVEPQRLRVGRYRIPIDNLPACFEALRIVHLTDTHYGPFMSVSHIAAAVRRANELRGDVVILTGDYVHRTPKCIGPGISIFKGLESRFGTLAVLGNHDHWEGADQCREAFDGIGTPLIDNGRLFLGEDGFHADPPSGAALCFGGVGDMWEDAVRFDLAVKDAPADMPRVVLAHNPDVAEMMKPDTRVDLLCCGHTHGGQVRAPFVGTPVVPSLYGQRYAHGLVEGPHCRVLISSGVGMALFPVRFGMRPEIVQIELTRVDRRD